MGKKTPRNHRSSGGYQVPSERFGELIDATCLESSDIRKSFNRRFVRKGIVHGHSESAYDAHINVLDSRHWLRSRMVS